MSDWNARSNLTDDEHAEIDKLMKDKRISKSQQFDRIMSEWLEKEREADENVVRTISNLRNRLTEHFLKTLDLSTFTPSSKFHFIIKNREHLTLLEESENKFKRELRSALGDAIIKYHMGKAIQIKLLSFDNRMTDEAGEDWLARKALPEEKKCKQIYTKLCMLPRIERFMNQYDNLKVSFEVDRSMLAVTSLHNLKVSHIDKMVMFNCMIMGFNGSIKYNEEKDEYTQTVTVMEPEDETVNNNPRMIPCVFRGNLTESLAIGQRKRIIGKYFTQETKEEKIHALLVDVIAVDDLEEKQVMQLSKRDLSIVKEMINTPMYEDCESSDGKMDRRLIMTGEENYIKHILKSFAPHIDDRDLEKTACILSLIGGDELNEYRAESHLALVGDPGCGKSELLKFAVKVAPKGAYVDASNATGKGLLFALDEHEGGKILRAGALVMNSGGMVGLDEFDKMRKEEQKQVNVAMEQQFAKYDKGGHNVVAATKTTVIMACNPVNDKWNEHTTIVDNLNFGASTISRYDLFIRVKNNTGEMANRRRVKHILRHSQHKQDKTLDPEYIKGLISYCKHQPVQMTEEAEMAIEEFYVEFKTIDQTDNANLPIEDRQLIGIIRLSCAYARLTFQPKVTKEVVETVVEFYKKCLNTLGMNTDKGISQMDLNDNAVNKDTFFEATFNNFAKDNKNGDVNYAQLCEKLLENVKHFPSDAAVTGYLIRRQKAGFHFEPKMGILRKMTQ
jgi:DNA replicative helicase MCM subunit Mcm2 (Cdc46/Mcm family)